jgi:hypothetical protein
MSAPWPFVDWWAEGRLWAAEDDPVSAVVSPYAVPRAELAALLAAPAAYERRQRRAYAAMHGWGYERAHGFLVVPDARPDFLLEPWMVRRADFEAIGAGERDPYDAATWTRSANRAALDRAARQHAAATARWRAAGASSALHRRIASPIAVGALAAILAPLVAVALAPPAWRLPIAAAGAAWSYFARPRAEARSGLEAPR